MITQIGHIEGEVKTTLVKALHTVKIEAHRESFAIYLGSLKVEIPKQAIAAALMEKLPGSVKPVARVLWDLCIRYHQEETQHTVPADRPTGVTQAPLFDPPNDDHVERPSRRTE